MCPRAGRKCRSTRSRALAGLAYVETAVRVMRPFVEGMPDRGRTARAVQRRPMAVSRHAAVTPLVQLDHRHWLLELFHGPTLAFKDVALQLLGLLFERFLSGARAPTSRSSARPRAIPARRRSTRSPGASNRHLHAPPEGPRQRRPAPADDDGARAQRPQYRDRWQLRRRAGDGEADVRRSRGRAAASTLSAVNSINWARLMAQVVYYFYAAVRLGAPDRPVAFSGADGQFRRRVRRLCRGADGAAGRAADRRDQRQRHPPPRAGQRRLFAPARSRRPRRRRWTSRSARNFERLLFDLSAAATAVRSPSRCGGFEATKAMQLRQCAARGRGGVVRQRADRCRRDGAGDALGAASMPAR